MWFRAKERSIISILANERCNISILAKEILIRRSIQESCFVIVRVSQSDAGSYECRATFPDNSQVSSESGVLLVNGM